jgi:peptide/nickel transport system ATP-binding protein
MSTKDALLTMRDVRIDGYSDDRWHHIIKGVDVTLKRGEILASLGSLALASLPLA